MKERNHLYEVITPADHFEVLYRRHFQGALIRSGASVIMWLFALTAFLANIIQINHFIGISLSVIYLILINPPTLLILKRITHRRLYNLFSIMINLLEILGYTAIIYFLGGIEALYLTPIYAALITYVGVVAPRGVLFVISILCGASFSIVVVAEHFGFLPHQGGVSSLNFPWPKQLMVLTVVTGLLLVVAYISSYAAGVLKKNRKRLRERNLELLEKTTKLEDAEKNLRIAHEELERRIEERTAELRETNDQLRVEIKERNQAEESLREKEEIYRLHFENVNDVIYSMDSQYIIRSVSPSVDRQLGYKPEEIVGKHITDLNILAEPYMDQAISDIMRIFSGERIASSIYEFISKDGTSKLGDVSGAPLFRDGEVDGLISVARDITERVRAEEEKKRLEAQLLRAQKMEAIGSLAGGVAHELNNILSGILSYPELLLMEIPKDSPLRKPLQTIQRSGEKAAAIVQDLLTLGRRGVQVIEVVSLNQIISDYLTGPEVENLKSHHPGIKLEADLEKDLLNIQGSPVHLTKTVINLVSNAAEAVREGGEIFISTANRYVDRPIKGYDNVQEGDYATLTVSDTGIGLSPEDRERIYEPFYTKKVMGRSGTGLGMAVVWGTVKDHGGYIDIQSALGKGTEFTLYFPVTRKETPKDKPSSSIEDYMGKGESILVVDDVEDQREIVSEMLKKLGYRVASVSSGEEAVEYMKNASADLLVLDMIMEPGIDGLETYKRILELHPGQKAVISSGYSETEDVRELQRLGGGAYIKKPYFLEKIGLAVKRELERKD